MYVVKATPTARHWPAVSVRIVQVNPLQGWEGTIVKLSLPLAGKNNTCFKAEPKPSTGIRPRVELSLVAKYDVLKAIHAKPKLTTPTNST